MDVRTLGATRPMAQPQRPWGARTRIPSLEAGSGRPTGRAVAGDERGDSAGTPPAQHLPYPPDPTFYLFLF